MQLKEELETEIIKAEMEKEMLNEIFRKEKQQLEDDAAGFGEHKKEEGGVAVAVLPEE